jgi:GT2 family glycosyltransferase
MKTDFCLAIPTINRADLLNEALAKYFIDFSTIHILIVDNGNQDIITRDELFEIYRPEKNLGVAGSWNFLIERASQLNYRRVLILNDDIYMGKNRLDIGNIINQFPHADLTKGTKDFCAFIITAFAYTMYGKFDTNFSPAYFEDNDYLYRLKLADAYVITTELLDPEIFRNSMTIMKDRSLNDNFQNNKDYYALKWGGGVGEETLTKPNI